MRFEKIDILRGIAIFLMILFHFNYSLLNIFSIDVLNFSETFWFYLGRIAALLFIFIFGISFFLAEKKYGNEIYKKYFKIGLILGLISFLISLLTFYFFREQLIIFGILHFFALSSLLILLFRFFKYYNLIVGIFIIIIGFYFIPIVDFKYLFFLGLKYHGFISADFYPIFPYFGFILLGYVFALFLNDFNKLSLLKLKNNQNFILNFIQYLGKKSLIIYLIHQPIIILLIYILINIKV